VFWSSGQQGFRLGRGERCDVVVESGPYLSIGCNEMPATLGERPSLSGSQATAACFSMGSISVIRCSTIAAPALAALALTGCSGTQEAARQAGDQVGQAAKEAAD